MRLINPKLIEEMYIEPEGICTYKIMARLSSGFTVEMDEAFLECNAEDKLELYKEQFGLIEL